MLSRSYRDQDMPAAAEVLPTDVLTKVQLRCRIQILTHCLIVGTIPWRVKFSSKQLLLNLNTVQQEWTYQVWWKENATVLNFQQKFTILRGSTNSMLLNLQSGQRSA
ncbi:unnamed protein product [Cylicostephanus goldi]|uniref:Uncharacterized protein n=1 Tax=Cylicostephanus goldi TaxID=71465 RepID=A0A3P7PUR8_CYLGO|nr:unnamed protein product [Cylicostephanus goldi]